MLQRSRRWKRIAVVAAVVFVSTATTADAGEVRGSVRAREGYGRDRSSENRHAFYWEEWNGFLDPRPSRIQAARELTVFLVGSGAPTAAVATRSVQFSGGGLLPSTIVARPNTTLQIENKDDFAHDLYAAGLDGFSPSETASGATRSVR